MSALRKVEALIFDMDGTMVDSMPWHAKAWIEYGARHGVECGEPRDPVVPVVEVVLTEEDRGGVVPADHIGTQGAHPRHQCAPEVRRIGQLTIGEAEIFDT